MNNDSNEVVPTVKGPVKLDDLGITLTHEHLSCIFEKRNEPKIWWLNEDQLSLDPQNISILKQAPYSSNVNLSFNDNVTREIMYDELSLFKNAGGNTIVENTSQGLHRNTDILKYYSLMTQINIIIGTGYYTADVQTDSIINQAYEQIYDTLLNDLTYGIVQLRTNNPAIKAGFIGEVGSNWPIHEFEKHSIRATGEIQAQMHCPVNLNPGTNEEALREVIRLYEEAGGNSSKAAISNIDRTLYYEDKFMEFMDDTKCYVQFDLFGAHQSFCVINNKYCKILSDAQRIKRIAKLKTEGNLHRVLMSHDIHTKNKLVTYGGYGYAHILKNVLPQMTTRNFTTNDTKILIIENPKRWLSRIQ